MTSAGKPGSPWQLKQVDAARRDILARLDGALAIGIEARLAVALNAIADPTRTFRPEDQLDRLLYVIAALAHHGRYGGLSERDANQLVSIAEAILLTHGVDKTQSTLSGLWGELHLARSQMLRLAGRTFESMWEQHLGHQASRRAPVGTAAFHSLAAGLRAQRLGLLEVAKSALARAATGDLPQRNVEQARLAQIQTHRLAGDLRTAAALLAELLASPHLSPLARRDAEWESLVHDARQSGDLAPLTVAVSPRGDHRYPTFALEAFLWSRAVKSRQFEERLPGMRTLRKTCGDLLGRAPAFRACYDACVSLDDAYDPARPLPLRTKALGQTLGEVTLLPSLDKELLFRVACFRWLFRAKQMEFAAFVFADYEARSLTLSSGTTRDVTGLVADVERDALLEHYVAPNLRSAS